MSLLDVKSAIERASNARLVLALEELARDQWVTLGFYGKVRGIDTDDAARRSLYRLKTTLAEHGVELEIEEKKGLISARFGTREIVDLIAPDVRKARVIVECLDAKREGRQPDLAGLAEETEVVDPEMITFEYTQRKTFGWITRKHGIGVKRVRKILVSKGAIVREPRARRVEERLPEAVVEKALEALRRGAIVADVAAILGCSERTARRFAKRHGMAFKEGRSLGPSHPVRVDDRFRNREAQ